VNSVQLKSWDRIFSRETTLLPGRSGVRISAVQEIFLFPERSRPALRSSQPPIQWLAGFIPQGKAVGSWCSPLAAFTVEVKHHWSYTSIPPYASYSRLLSSHGGLVGYYRYGLTVNVHKTKYLKCSRRQDQLKPINIENKEIEQVR